MIPKLQNQNKEAHKNLKERSKKPEKEERRRLSLSEDHAINIY